MCDKDVIVANLWENLRKTKVMDDACANAVTVSQLSSSYSRMSDASPIHLLRLGLV